ncbi:[FeFe] hydrogenase H-cluster maturation GTPase HydF [Carboxydothermus islandicus]|uniref:[FeFe] hydrogenase H-cluster maturation GTPase HydF n=1 Tax=Carboxydothermus islandicus TaxID=661089 RepID=A0A1L8D1Q0_9THEO|nr:[FeFe] hydrogenase H-cluster maturation GTPase HydF [Carboxydothermus islandicus]GAV25088.1 [FeFe] hydrogenase H-cluster maturation GTPase HydF [Carboxydothermus islandicus]
MENSLRLFRKTIGIFGRCNAGKSTLLNNIIGEEKAITSSIPGTTTDPNRRAFELLPYGPVEFIDTPGLDDTSVLGEIRKTKTREVLATCSVVILVGNTGFKPEDWELQFIEQNQTTKKIIGIINMVESKTENLESWKKFFEKFNIPYLLHDCKNGANSAVRNFLVQNLQEKVQKTVVADLVPKGKSVVLVIPIDAGAPKGRIIQPQMLVLRELLDNYIVTHVVQPENLRELLLKLNEEPGLVITDSQVFAKVRDILPENISLTSFSILMIRYRGELSIFLEGIQAIKRLREGAKIGIFEACVHHVQKDDIGSEKIPAILKQLTGRNFSYTLYKGREFKINEKLDLAVHCGGCMLTNEEIHQRVVFFKEQGIKVVNYGMLFAYDAGILERALKPLGGEEIADRFDG